jgi:hypothetical protein
MSCRRRSKKHPCRICRKWFMPHPRVGDRQKTCGDHECMRKWHARKCAEWNRKNRNCAQENHLSNRLALAAVEKEDAKGISSAAATPKSPVSASRPAAFPRLPRSLIQEVIGVQHFVIIEYVARQLFRSVQEVIKSQHFEITGDLAQLPPRYRSRSDSVSDGP